MVRKQPQHDPNADTFEQLADPHDVMPGIVTHEDLTAIAAKIAAGVVGHEVIIDKPLNPTLADLGWTERDTLAADVPHKPRFDGRRLSDRAGMDSLVARADDQAILGGYSGKLMPRAGDEGSMRPSEISALMKDALTPYIEKREAAKVEPPSILHRGLDNPTRNNE